MKSKRRAFLGGNTRFRLVLTLGLAVVLPALTLIYVSFQHVKSIKRDKKVEALIHRDFQYLLYAGIKKMNGQAYAMTEEARDLFPTEADSEEERRRKLKLILKDRPWFDHVFLFDAKGNKKAAMVEAQPGLNPTEVDNWGKMYASWLGLEGPYLCEQIQRKPKPMVWYSGEGHDADQRYHTTAIFSVPKISASKERIVLGGASFDPTYLKDRFFPEFLTEFTSQKFGEDPGAHFAPQFHELTTQQVNEQKEQRLAIKIFPGDAQKSEPDRPLAISAGWGEW